MTLARRPADATLSVTKAAHVLGVHPNTIRAWSAQGRLRFYRIDDRGDRRYRLGDLQRFLAQAESHPEPSRGRRNLGGEPARFGAPLIGADVVEMRTRPLDHQPAGPTAVVRPIVASQAVHEAPARTRLDMAILTHLADLLAQDADTDAVATAIVELLHDRAGHDLVAVLERRDGRLVARAARGAGADWLGSLAESQGLPARALRAAGPVAETAQVGMDWLGGSGSLLGCRVAVAVRGATGGPWGVLLVADEGGPVPPERILFVSAVARALAVAVHADELREATELQLHRAEALRRIAVDIGSKLDVDRILAGIVEHARSLFGAERAGDLPAPARRKRSAWRRAAASPPGISPRPARPALPALPAEAVATRRPLFAVRYRDDPRAQRAPVPRSCRRASTPFAPRHSWMATTAPSEC